MAGRSDIDRLTAQLRATIPAPRGAPFATSAQRLRDERPGAAFLVRHRINERRPHGQRPPTILVADAQQRGEAGLARGKPDTLNEALRGDTVGFANFDYETYHEVIDGQPPPDVPSEMGKCEAQLHACFGVDANFDYDEMVFPSERCRVVVKAGKLHWKASAPPPPPPRRCLHLRLAAACGGLPGMGVLVEEGWSQQRRRLPPLPTLPPYLGGGEGGGAALHGGRGQRREGGKLHPAHSRTLSLPPHTAPRSMPAPEASPPPPAGPPTTAPAMHGPAGLLPVCGALPRAPGGPAGLHEGAPEDLRPRCVAGRQRCAAASPRRRGEACSDCGQLSCRFRPPPAPPPPTAGWDIGIYPKDGERVLNVILCCKGLPLPGGGWCAAARRPWFWGKGKYTDYLVQVRRSSHCRGTPSLRAQHAAAALELCIRHSAVRGRHAP